MKTKHLLTVLLMISASLGILSCSDDDEHFFLYQMDQVPFPDQAISGTTIDIVSGGSVGITGGKAPYTATIADEQIATVKVDEDIVRISSVRLGTTHLIVKDADGRTIKIGVKVVTFVQSFTNTAVMVKMEGGTIDDEGKKALEKQVIADADMDATGGVRFVYDTKSSGTMNLLPSKDSSSLPISALFVKQDKQVDGINRPTFYVTYNNKQHEFYFSSPERAQTDQETRSVGPTLCWLVEDVTEVYQLSYPTVTSVLRIYKGSLSH